MNEKKNGNKPHALFSALFCSSIHFVLLFVLFFCSFCCLMSCSFRAVCLLLRTLFFFYPPALFSSRNNSGWAGQSLVAASSCLLRHKGPGCPPARATCCSSHLLETKPASSPPSFADRSVTTLDCLQSKLHCKGLHVHSSVTVVIDSFPCLRIHCGKVCGGDGEREGRGGEGIVAVHANWENEVVFHFSPCEINTLRTTKVLIQMLNKCIPDSVLWNSLTQQSCNCYQTKTYEKRHRKSPCHHPVWYGHLSLNWWVVSVTKLHSLKTHFDIMFGKPL